MNAIRANRTIIFLVVALVLASTAGFFAATAIGVGTQAPTLTTTVNVATGPQGPPGSPGAESCPDGSKFGELVINHPGGQTKILTCIEN